MSAPFPITPQGRRWPGDGRAQEQQRRRLGNRKGLRPAIIFKPVQRYRGRVETPISGICRAPECPVLECLGQDRDRIGFAGNMIQHPGVPKGCIDAQIPPHRHEGQARVVRDALPLDHPCRCHDSCRHEQHLHDRQCRRPHDQCTTHVPHFAPVEQDKRQLTIPKRI